MKEIFQQISIFDIDKPKDELYVRQIGYDDTKPFLLNIHYARRMPCITHAYGLFKGGTWSVA